MIIFVSCRSDTVRYALDILSILTVVPKTQLLLSEAVAVVDEEGSSVSTIGRCYQRHYQTFIKCCLAEFKKNVFFETIYNSNASYHTLQMSLPVSPLFCAFKKKMQCS